MKYINNIKNFTAKYRRSIIAVFMLLVSISIVIFYALTKFDGSTFLHNYYAENYIIDTSSFNAVTAIYLNYRVFDTFFEALLLMISVTGIMYFFEEKNTYDQKKSLRTERHLLLENALVILYPLTILFGFYLIINGLNTPGGGFQGGAVLAAVFMSRYYVNPDAVWHIKALKGFEKLFYILIIVSATIIIIFESSSFPVMFNRIYLVVMNVFIGIKVFCGLSIIFFYFAYIDTSNDLADKE